MITEEVLFFDVFAATLDRTEVEIDSNDNGALQDIGGLPTGSVRTNNLEPRGLRPGAPRIRATAWPWPAVSGVRGGPFDGFGC